MKKTVVFLVIILLTGMNFCASTQTGGVAPQAVQASPPVQAQQPQTAPQPAYQTAGGGQQTDIPTMHPQQVQQPQTVQPVLAKPKVAVYVTGGKNANENKALAARITHGLVNSGRYSAIERADAFLDQVAREMVTQRSGAIDDKQISELGRQAGASFVCVGEILEVFGDHQISARIINVTTVEVVASGVAEGALRNINDFATLSNAVVASMLGVAPVTVTTPASVLVPTRPATQQTVAGRGSVVAGANLTEKLRWLQTNAESNAVYSIEMNGSESIGPQTLSYQGKTVTIRLRGTERVQPAGSPKRVESGRCCNGGKGGREGGRHGERQG
jgi:TolB-like protein